MAVVLEAVTANFNKGIQQSEKLLDGFSKQATGAGDLIKGALAGIGAAALGKQIIDVTSEFQKFSAVLTNTLGSSSAANIAMHDITEFAKKTPFAVDELTGSFVKLANQGFTPTTDELRKLGDLASSTGKGFDTLAEAIIDAQTGEFERLKEFGVRASKEGDKVKFTFKGVQTQTEFTSKAIRDYILSLGDAKGVSGAMAVISETLGGQISNLGDSWTGLLKVIGDGNKGALSGAVAVLSEIINKVTEWATTDAQEQQEKVTAEQSKAVEQVKKLVAANGDLLASSDKVIAKYDLIIDSVSRAAAAYSVTTKEGREQIEAFNRTALVAQGAIIAIQDYTKAELARAAAIEEANKKANASTGIISDIEKELKRLEEQRKHSFSTEEIANFNRKIHELKEELGVLNASNPLSNFAKTLKGDFIANGSNQLPEFDLKFKKPDMSSLFPAQAQVKGPDFTKVQEAFGVIDKAYQTTGALSEKTLSEMTAQIEKTGQTTINTSQSSALAWDQQIARQMAAAESAAAYGQVVGDALGAAISGQMSFADAAKKITADLLKTFLARALGGIIASAATSGGPPPVAIALAAAGVAAISAMFSKIGGPSKSVSGSVAKPTAAANPARQYKSMSEDIRFDAKFVIEGDKLTAVAKTDDYQKQRLG